MSVTSIDAGMLAKYFLAGVGQLESRKEYINELNVFPVPDGDTGTNMTLTILSAAKEVQSLSHPTMETLAKAISSGSLRGARGNSGVILSQLLRGFTKEIADKDTLDTKTVAAAFLRGQNTAYKAVMKPKEGTILTVAKEVATEAAIACEEEEDFIIFGERVLNKGYEALENTPNLLPVLKEAGVVDSGGQGLMEVLQGVYNCICGKEVDLKLEDLSTKTPTVTKLTATPHLKDEELTYGYCTEFIIMTKRSFTDYDERELKEYLMEIGDSLVCVVDDDLVKIHVHTDHPGQAFEKGLTYGELTSMKVDNLREEHREVLFKNAAKQEEDAPQEQMPHKDIGFIAVSIGDGINKIFKDLGVDYIIEGGQTMNPSTDDMLHAIEQVNADHVFILPNNKNIILAANQARDLTKDKVIHVIPTKTIPQGISSMINYMPEKDAEANDLAMKESIDFIRTGQITYAVRDTHIDDKEIHEGDIMGIGDRGILAVGKDINATAVDTIHAMADDDSEIISIYYGNDISKKQVDELKVAIEEQYPDCELEIYAGGQPIYYYVMSVE